MLVKDIKELSDEELKEIAKERTKRKPNHYTGDALKAQKELVERRTCGFSYKGTDPYSFEENKDDDPMDVFFNKPY